MEIYYKTNSTLKLILDSDADGNVLLTVTRLADGVNIIENEVADNPSVGTYTYELTETNTNSLGPFKRTWSYELDSKTYTREGFFFIVVGYVFPDEFRDAFPSFQSLSDEEIIRKEKLARMIIDVACKQKFDFEENVTKIVEGTNEDWLPMPRRLYLFNTIKIDGTDDITDVVEKESNYYLRQELSNSISVPDIKRDIWGLPFFKKKIFYHVAGSWGWEYVPENIKEGTMLLMNDYFNDDHLLRQHGIVAANFGDTSYRIEWPLKGSTGNYDTDRLLEPYKNVNYRML